jgi:hypothetical protein
MSAEQTDAPADLRPWGWAPGNYAIICDDCTPLDVAHSARDLPTGDKRAWRCEACAKAARERDA